MEPTTQTSPSSSQVELEGVNFLRLQFTDLDGTLKNVEVPQSQFKKALSGQIMFDGSSIEGFVRIEESDMYLKPDLYTLKKLPWDEGTARVICDVMKADGKTPFEGDPRAVLKRQIEKALEMGFLTAFGPEAEFFLFEEGLNTHDRAGYFDLAPADRGEECRQDIISALEDMGFEVEAAHHEVAPGQHEIDFKYADALTTADRLVTFRMVVRKIASLHGLHATFMPKPVVGINGSGMHTHQSLFSKNSRQNVFASVAGSLSPYGEQYVAGIIKHARAICAVTNPLVNSYKRLVPGFEAPVIIAWSDSNRSAMIRIPAARGEATRMELRMPDPSCNPYLAFAVMLGSGLDGIANGMQPPVAASHNLFRDDRSDVEERGVLPANMWEAVQELRSDALMTEILGDHVMEKFVQAREAEWNDYIQQVHQWEVERYADKF